MIQSILSKDNPKKAREIEIKIIKRLSKHKGNPKFIELGERLEELREKYELGFLTSLDFLNKLLNLARDLVEAEREVEPEDERKKAKAALTELFQQVKNEKTPIMVERIVSDIDDVVRIVRFVYRRTVQTPQVTPQPEVVFIPSRYAPSPLPEPHPLAPHYPRHPVECCSCPISLS